MGSEELSLTWDDHHNTLVGVFEKLLDNCMLVDCTIAAEGQYLKAHKVVLSACSPYFETLFMQENEKNPIVVLKDIKFQELKSMIDFVYRGKVRIAEDRLEDFVAAAESLQIKGLGGDKEDVSDSTEILSLHKRKNCVSPIPPKPKRGTCKSNENTSSPSFDIDSNESDSCESIAQNEESVNVPISLPSGVIVSRTSASSSMDCVQENFNSIRVGPPTYMKPVQSCFSLSETQSSLSSTEIVLKSEPEPITEVSLPETECLIEPKDEMYVQELPLLDNGDGTHIKVPGAQRSQQNAIVYSNAAATTECATRLSAQSANTSVLDVSLRQRLPTAAETVVGHSVADAPLRPLPRHTCPQCGRVFSAPSFLARHMRRHTGERPFGCRVCGKAFTRKSVLQTHQRLHTGERPYQCSQCVFAATTNSNLLAHVRRTHGGSLESLQLR